MSYFSNFRAVYDELCDAIIGSRHQFYADHLTNLFETIDSTPSVSDAVADLQSRADFKSFMQEAEESNGSFAGSGILRWPVDREERLGVKLLLFREMAERRIEPWEFSFHYVSGDSDLNENVHALSDQIFKPFSRDLRRYLEEQSNTAEGDETIPASDRTVSLNHNSDEFRHVEIALDQIERVLRETNDYEDTEDKMQRQAEISAGRKLLEPTHVRLRALWVVLLDALKYLGKKFADSAIGLAATAALLALKLYFGL